MGTNKKSPREAPTLVTPLPITICDRHTIATVAGRPHGVGDAAGAWISAGEPLEKIEKKIKVPIVDVLGGLELPKQVVRCPCLPSPCGPAAAPRASSCRLKDGGTGTATYWPRTHDGSDYLVVASQCQTFAIPVVKGETYSRAIVTTRSQAASKKQHKNATSHHRTKRYGKTHYSRSTPTRCPHRHRAAAPCRRQHH